MNSVKNFADYFASKNSVSENKDSSNKNEITYKGKLIKILFPSGMYEVYSDVKERFIAFAISPTLASDCLFK
jgi:hypothetical protein